MGDEEDYEIVPKEPNPQQALRYLVRGLHFFIRGGFEDEERYFKSFVICNFDRDDFERAFNEIQEPLPEKTTPQADFECADELLKKVSEELDRKAGSDMSLLYTEELKEYLVRKRLRAREWKEIAEVPAVAEKEGK